MFNNLTTMAAAVATGSSPSPSTTLIEQPDMAGAASGTFAGGIPATNMIANTNCVLLFNQHTLNCATSIDEGATFIENDNLRNIVVNSLGYNVWSKFHSPEKQPDYNQKFCILKVNDTFIVYTPPLDDRNSYYRFTSTDGIVWNSQLITYEKKNYATHPTGEYTTFPDDENIYYNAYTTSWHIGYAKGTYVIFVYKRTVNSNTITEQPYIMTSSNGVDFTVVNGSNFNASLFPSDTANNYFPGLRASITNHATGAAYSPVITDINGKFIIFTEWMFNNKTFTKDDGTTGTGKVAYYATSNDCITWNSEIYAYDTIGAENYMQPGVSIHNLFSRIFVFGARNDIGTSSSGGDARYHALIKAGGTGTTGVSVDRYIDRNLTDTANYKPFTREAIIAYNDAKDKFISFNNPGSNVTWWSADFQICQASRTEAASMKWETGSWYANSVIDASSKINSNEKVVMSDGVNDSRAVAYTNNYIIVAFISGEIFRIPKSSFVLNSRTISYNNQYKKNWSYCYPVSSADWNQEFIMTNIYQHTDNKYYALYSGGVAVSSVDGINWKKINSTAPSGVFFNTNHQPACDLYHNGSVWCLATTNGNVAYYYGTSFSVYTSTDLSSWTLAATNTTSGRHVAGFMKIPGRKLWATVTSAGNLYYSNNGTNFSLIGNVIFASGSESETNGITCMTSDGNRLYFGRRSTSGPNGDFELVMTDVDARSDGSRSFSPVTLSGLAPYINNNRVDFVYKSASSYSITRLYYVGNDKIYGVYSAPSGTGSGTVYAGLIKFDTKNLSLTSYSTSLYTIVGGSNLQLSNADNYYRAGATYLRQNDMFVFDSNTETIKLMYTVEPSSANRQRPILTGLQSILLLNYTTMKISKWMDTNASIINGTAGAGFASLKKIKNKHFIFAKHRAYSTSEPNTFSEILESSGSNNYNKVTASRLVVNNTSGIVIAYDEFSLSVAVSSDGGVTWNSTLNLRELVKSTNAIKYDIFIDDTMPARLRKPNIITSYPICVVNDRFEVNISPVHEIANSYRFYSTNGIDWYYERVTYSTTYPIATLPSEIRYTETDYSSTNNKRYMWIGNSQPNVVPTRAMVCDSSTYTEDTNLSSVLATYKLKVPKDIQYNVLVNGSYNSDRCKIFSLSDRLVSFHESTDSQTEIYACQSFDGGSTWSVNLIVLDAVHNVLPSIFYIDGTFVIYCNTSFSVITPCDLSVDPTGFVKTYDNSSTSIYGTRERMLFNKNTNKFITLNNYYYQTLESSGYLLGATSYNPAQQPLAPPTTAWNLISIYAKIDPTTPVSQYLRLSFGANEYGQYGWNDYTGKRIAMIGSNIVMISNDADIFTFNKTENTLSTIKYNSTLKPNRKSAVAQQIYSNIYKHIDGKHYVLYGGSRRMIATTDAISSETIFDDYVASTGSDHSINQPDVNPYYHISHNGTKWIFLTTGYNNPSILIRTSNSLSSADLTSCWNTSTYYTPPNTSQIISHAYDDVNKRYFFLCLTSTGDMTIAYSTNGIDWNTQSIATSSTMTWNTTLPRISLYTDGSYLYFGANSSLYRASINSNASLNTLEKIDLTYLATNYPSTTMKIGYFKMISNKLYGVWWSYRANSSNWGYFVIENPQAQIITDVSNSCTFYKSNVSSAFTSEYNHVLVDTDRVDYDNINTIRVYPMSAYATDPNVCISINISNNRMTIIKDESELYTVRAIKRVNDKWLLAGYTQLYTLTN